MYGFGYSSGRAVAAESDPPEGGDRVFRAERNVRFAAEIAREKMRVSVKPFHAVDSESHPGAELVVVAGGHSPSSTVSNSMLSDSEICGDGSRREYSGEGISKAARGSVGSPLYSSFVFSI